jgi:alkylation response protein AidB-like acyl-CoA dehydrogenase
MVFTCTEDQQALRDGIAPFCAAINEGHIERDGRAEFDHDAWKLLRRSGILGLPFADRWGGLEQDLVTTMFVLEGLGKDCRDGGLLFSTTTHIVSTGVPIAKFGSAGLKDRYLPAICDGSLIGSHAISEPGSGSDALNMRTTATKVDGGWVLNGSKTFISNAPIADLMVVYAKSDENAGPLGITAFVVETDSLGMSIGKPIAKMGLKTSPMAEVFFDECFVPAENVIGSRGMGFLVLDHVMKWEILCSFVVNVGEMAHRIERCVEYAKERHQFGRPIGANQSVANRIVDMLVATESARKWLYDTAEKMQRGDAITTDLAITKLVASEANLQTALAAVNVFGGNGYMAEYGLEKDLRNAVGGTIYSGTSDIQRSRIAAMLKLPTS